MRDDEKLEVIQRLRTANSSLQLEQLDHWFQWNQNPNNFERTELASSLGISETQVSHSLKVIHAFLYSDSPLRAITMSIVLEMFSRWKSGSKTSEPASRPQELLPPPVRPLHPNTTALTPDLSSALLLKLKTTRTESSDR